MRISRKNQVIGEFSLGQIKRGIKDGSLLDDDTYYDEDVSDWLPLADLLAKLAAPKPDKASSRPCYCGSSLPFHICHGDGSQY